MGGMNTDSAEAKLARADRHIAALAAMNHDVARRCADSVTAGQDVDAGEYVYSVGQLPTVPDEYSVTLGDAVHNLRTALDHLARSIVLNENLEPKDRPGGTMFPTRHQRQAKPLVTPTPSDAALAVVDMLQPYNDAHPKRSPLYLLSELDNIDKHRQLLVAVVLNTGGGWFGPLTPVAWSELKSNSELARFRHEPDEPGDVRDPTFHFAICLNEEVLPPTWKLREAHECITEIRDHIRWDVLSTVRVLGS